MGTWESGPQEGRAAENGWGQRAQPWPLFNVVKPGGGRSPQGRTPSAALSSPQMMPSAGKIEFSD